MADHTEDSNYDDKGNGKHYKHGFKEVIEMMEDIWGPRYTAIYCDMNAFKYRMRLGHKKGQSVDLDMTKVKWYEDKAKELHKKYIPGTTQQVQVGPGIYLDKEMD